MIRTFNLIAYRVLGVNKLYSAHDERLSIVGVCVQVCKINWFCKHFKSFKKKVADMQKYKQKNALANL